MQGVFTALADRLAPSTVQIVRKIAGGVFNAAVRDRLIAESPCRGIKLPEVRRAEIPAMTPEQLSALAAAIDPRFMALIRTGVGTGLRPGELFGMRLSNVYFFGRSIKVREQVQTRGCGSGVHQTQDSGQRPHRSHARFRRCRLGQAPSGLSNG